MTKILISGGRRSGLMAAAMAAASLGFFSMPYATRTKRRAMKSHPYGADQINREALERAEAKRARKRARPNGHYNG